MKKTILQLVFIAFTTIGFGQSGAKIEFLNKDNTIDYGTVSKDSDNGLRTFEFKNTGDAPLVITDIKSSCGCTVPQDWSRLPLAPGESGKFSVKFNGSGANKITKTITVTANTEKGSEVVKITAFVKPDPNKVNKVLPAKS